MSLLNAMGYSREKIMGNNSYQLPLALLQARDTYINNSYYC
jgi:hypothetical protein